MSKPSGPPTLTPRERQVADLIFAGKMAKEMAAALAMSEHTLRHHIDALGRKYRCRGMRAIAIAIAKERLAALEKRFADMAETRQFRKRRKRGNG